MSTSRKEHQKRTLEMRRRRRAAEAEKLAMARERELEEARGVFTYFEFEIELIGIDPPIRRRFLLPKAATFMDLHDAIQVAGPWSFDHMFQFLDKPGRGQVLAGPQPPWGDALDVGETEVPASEAKLREYFTSAGKKCVYEYDFGDGWQVSVQVKQMAELPDRFNRRLLDGQRAFPPEDCGGVWGYYSCLEALDKINGDMNKADKEERKEWLGDWDPEAFDIGKMKKKFDRK